MGKTRDLFQKTKDTRNISCKDGLNNRHKWYRRNRSRWQEYTEELYKKELLEPDNHDDVITHLEPDILECEVKRALGSITTNKASGGDGIPVELFQILKDDAVKVLHSICQQIWKTQQLELEMEQQAGCKSGKEYFTAVYCHLAYLTYMQSSTS